MEFDILNRWTGAVQFTAEIECGDDVPTSVKIGLAVRAAVRVRASLVGASLVGALGLEPAKWDYNGKMVCTIPPVFFLGSTWPVMFSDAHIKIGRQVHATAEWAEFTEAQISAMDGLSDCKLWKQWKCAILALAEAHQPKVKAEAHDEAAE